MCSHGKKGGKQVFANCTPKRLSLRGSGEGERPPPQEDWVVLQLRWERDKAQGCFLKDVLVRTWHPPHHSQVERTPSIEPTPPSASSQSVWYLLAPFYFTLFLAFPAPHEVILALTAPRSAGFAKAVRVKCTNNMMLTGFWLYLCNF